MKKLYSSLLFLVVVSFAAQAQDEGTIKAKQRFERDKSIFFSIGPSVVLGKNLGDYGTGMAFELGFLKRMNKVLSWGPSLTYQSFSYDQTKTYKYYYDVNQDVAAELKSTGGDVGLVSLGANFKLNFIPVSDNTTFTIYGIVTPFLSLAQKSAITQNVDYYNDTNEDGVYAEFNSSQTITKDNGYPDLGSSSKITGGAYLGLGIEFFPAKQFSFFAQGTVGYTLPIKYVSTQSYLHEEDQYIDANGTVYYDADNSFYIKEFPVVKKGFGATSIRVGLSYNF